MWEAARAEEEAKKKAAAEAAAADIKDLGTINNGVIMINTNPHFADE